MEILSGRSSNDYCSFSNAKSKDFVIDEVIVRALRPRCVYEDVFGNCQTSVRFAYEDSEDSSLLLYPNDAVVYNFMAMSFRDASNYLL